MRFGINSNPSAGRRPATIDELIEQVAAAARHGFASVSVAHIMGFDALTTIALAGRVVADVELATAVVPIYAHHPIALAQQALTTQAAVGGRLLLGIGLSHRPVVTDRWGLPFERPVEYMEEYLAVLEPLLRDKKVDYTGQRIRARTELTLPDVPAPPVLLAALGERMLRLAGEQTAGTITWMVGPKTLASHVTPRILEAARGAGRPAPRIMVGLPICVTADIENARARAARAFERYGQLPSYRAMLDREGVAGPADVAIVGNESSVERQLAELESAGATDFVASVFGSADEQQQSIDFLAAQVKHGRGAPV